MSIIYYSAYVRAIAADTVSYEVADQHRLGSVQRAYLGACLAYAGTGQSWVWGKPAVELRIHTSLQKRGLIDGHRVPNEDIRARYVEVLSTTSE